MRKKSSLYLMAIMMIVMLSVGFASCNSDDDEDDGISTSPITLYADKTEKIGGNVREMVSDNTFVATVDNNIVTGMHVGEAIVTVNRKHKIRVSVIPFYHIMDDPITEWGISKATVKARQRQGTLYKEENDIITYHNCGNAAAVGYTFSNGQLDGVLVLISTSKLDSYVNYLKERYAFYPKEIRDYTFVGLDSYSLSDAKTAVALSVYSVNYLSCVYMPAQKFNSSSSSKAFANSIFEDL